MEIPSLQIHCESGKKFGIIRPPLDIEVLNQPNDTGMAN